MCPRLTVNHTWCGVCRGEYEVQQNLSVPWAPERAVYKKIAEEMYIYWNANGHDGWSVGAAFGTFWDMSK